MHFIVASRFEARKPPRHSVKSDEAILAAEKGLLLHFEYNSTKVTKLPSVV